MTRHVVKNVVTEKHSGVDGKTRPARQEREEDHQKPDEKDNKIRLPMIILLLVGRSPFPSFFRQPRDKDPFRSRFEALVTSLSRMKREKGDTAYRSLTDDNMINHNIVC